MELIKPESKDHWLSLRLQDVTSTETSALFGLNPYMTEFELWHRKKDQESVVISDNERMRWGDRLEKAIAEGIADDNGWMVHPFKDYGRLPELRAGSSFDYMVAVPNEDNTKPIEGLLEIKNVDGLQFRNKWIVEDGKVVEAPPHIELQVQHQLMVTGYPYAYIGALVGGNSVTLLKRTPDEGIISAIKAKIIKFWNSIEHNMPPDPDFVRDAEFIKLLYNYAEPGKILDGTEELETLAKEYKNYAAEEKEAKLNKDAIKARILLTIGDAERVKSDRFTITATAKAGFTRPACDIKPGRNFRVTLKKGAQDARETT